MTPPLVIGISSYARDGSPPAFSLPCGYIDGVRAAGAIPLILPPGEPEPQHLFEVIDGLILAGGGDIAPTAYGGDPHETIYLVSEERDRFEFALTRAALLRRDMPLLCICRGMQVLNVVCGGSLHAHVPDRFGESVEHRLPPRRPAHHPIRMDPASRLAGILGATSLSVCSWHHQAIDRLGADLRAVGWAADGVIEAVEHTSHPWCMGVQWHPEMQIAEPGPQRMFAALLAVARTYKRHGTRKRRTEE